MLFGYPEGHWYTNCASGRPPLGMGTRGPLKEVVQLLRVAEMTVSGIHTVYREYYQEQGNMHDKRFGWGFWH